MKNLYNTIREVLQEEAGFSIAPYCQNTFEDVDRTVRLEMGIKSQLSPSFDMYNATFTVCFMNGQDWASNAAKLSDALMTFIPLEDRPDEECRLLPDNSYRMQLLDVPEFSEIEVTIDENTADEEHSVEVTINYCVE